MILDLGTLTPDEIARLQADMLEDMHDADARPLVSAVQPMEVLMVHFKFFIPCLLVSNNIIVCRKSTPQIQIS